MESTHENLHPPTHPLPPSLLRHLITNLPKHRRPRRSMHVKILVEPVAQNTPSGTQSADLHAFAAPAFFAVKDGEGGPADDAEGGAVDGA